MASTDVTEKDVLDIMETALTARQITPHLRIARNRVTARLTSAKGYSDDDRHDATQLLTAHYATVFRDPEITAEGHGATSATYGMLSGGEGLKGSSFGQALLGMLLDPTDLEAPVSIGLRVMGSDPSGRLDDVPDVP